jgi:hypothetical protein
LFFFSLSSRSLSLSLSLSRSFEGINTSWRVSYYITSRPLLFPHVQPLDSLYVYSLYRRSLFFLICRFVFFVCVCLYWRGNVRYEYECECEYDNFVSCVGFDSLKAISTLCDAFWKHDHDPRYQSSFAREKIASIYFPFIIAVYHYKKSLNKQRNKQTNKKKTNRIYTLHIIPISIFVIVSLLYSGLTVSVLHYIILYYCCHPTS